MPSITPHIFAELIYWSYANLAMAHDDINRGLPTYDKTSFIIRMRMYKGLISGKMENGARCVYCGSAENLSVDHLFPRIKGDADNIENLVCCCKSCNSSKKNDLIVWYNERGQFPSIMVQRRYLKLVHQQCQDLGLMDKTITEVDDTRLPFSLPEIPTMFPKCSEMTLN